MDCHIITGWLLTWNYQAIFLTWGISEFWKIMELFCFNIPPPPNFPVLFFIYQPFLFFFFLLDRIDCITWSSLMQDISKNFFFMLTCYNNNMKLRIFLMSGLIHPCKHATLKNCRFLPGKIGDILNFSVVTL